jgi:hypothetical protein
LVSLAFGVRKRTCIAEHLGNGNFVSVCFGAAPSIWFIGTRPDGRHIGHRVLFDSRYQVIALFQEAANDFSRGIVGGEGKIDRFTHAQRIDQHNHLIQQRALISIGKDDPLVNTTGQRHSEDEAAFINIERARQECPKMYSGLHTIQKTGG